MSVKYYTNPERNKPEQFKPYVPQYQEKEIEPIVHSSIPLPAGHYALNLKATPSQDNPRLPRPAMRQPYAEAVPSPVGVGRGALPNVGNNIEQAWVSEGEQIIDDITDNNDFVDPKVFNFSEQQKQQLNGRQLQFVAEDTLRDLPNDEEVLELPMTKPFLTQHDLQNVIDTDLSKVVASVEENEYLLLINGGAICSGNFEDIQQQTQDLVFGKHPLAQGNPVPAEDIIVLKRMKINIGVFLA
jgi:hypothetical protein